MIYLDSAATTLHKPGTVPRAVVRGMRRFASPGRGGYRAAMEAAEVLYTCRTLAADLFDVSIRQFADRRRVCLGSTLGELAAAVESDRRRRAS